MEHILVENLVAVATLGKLVLYVREQDKDNEQALGMLVNTDNSMSYSFGLVQKILKFGEYDILKDDKILQEYYQDRIGKTFQGNAIYQMMSNFAEQIDIWSKLEDKWSFETTDETKYMSDEK